MFYSIKEVNVLKNPMSLDMGVVELNEYFDKRIKRLEENTYTLEYDFFYEKGLIKYILSFGTEEVIKPDFFRQKIKEYLNKMIRKYKN